MATIRLLLTHPEFWLVVYLAALGLFMLGRKLRLRWWPAWLMRVILVALALLAIFITQWDLFQQPPVVQRQVLLIDQSDSIAPETRRQALEQAERWRAEEKENTEGPGAESSPGEKRSRSIVVFGSEAHPLLAAKEQASAAQPDGAQVEAALPALDGRASNLPAALALAADLLGSQPGQVLLASDGLTAQPGEVRAAVNRLAEQGHTLDVIPLAPRPAENDLALGSLVAPKNLWAGTPVDLLVPVIGAWPGNALQLELSINGRVSNLAAQAAESADRDLNTTAPLNAALYHFQIPSLPEGMVTLEVTARGTGPEQADPFPENNQSFSVLQVFPPPRVLFVSADPAAGPVMLFRQALASKQIHLDTIEPDELSTNLEALQRYRVIFLENLLANQLTSEQMTALQVFVSRQAGGLVLLGGRNSFTLGGYQGTPLEAMLPVRLEPPPRTQRPPIAFELILDRSSSMDVGEIAKRPIRLAREAAMRAVETLHAEDFIGVLTFSDKSEWRVPLRTLGGAAGLQEALDAISRVDAGGSTYMFEALREGGSRMLGLPVEAPQSRHILLLSDGQSTDGTDLQFQRLAELIQARGITISAIAIGEGADEDVMQKIAEAGKGRFYFVEDVDDLPKILIAESKAARSENVQAGQTSLKAPENGHPVLSGLPLDQLPLLSGYNALQSKAKEGAEDILVSTSFEDPLFSVWQYGLGRVAAWTSDLGQEWTGDWQADNQGAFWAQVVRYMLVDPLQSPAQASVQVEPTRLRVAASIYTPDGSPLNLAEVKFSYARPDGKASTFRLPQYSAGLYQAEIARPPEGAYRAVLSYPGADGQVHEVPAPFAVNAPIEWLPPLAGTGAANLQDWAAAAGGQTLRLEDIAQAEQSASPEQERSLVNWLRDGWWLLLLALVILWPLEIAIRRRWLPWME